MTTNKKTSLSHSLVLWFLLLSLLPLSIVSWISYQQAKNSLTEAAVKTLEESASLSGIYIKSWFDYRIMDIKTQSENPANIQLLKNLSEEFNQSQLPLKAYTHSSNWEKTTTQENNNLISLIQNYDYIDDIMLIDIQGNILYSLKNNTILGTNLFSGPKASSLFSRSAKRTLETDEILFSDLEKIATSGHIYGFLSSPIKNKLEENIGLIAIQFHIERVINALKPVTHKNTSIKHYLVGSEGRLRTPISNDNNEILNKVIDTAQFHLWKSHGFSKMPYLEGKEETLSYMGPNNKNVFGTHSALQLPGKEWAVISEIDESEALSPAYWQGIITLISVLLTAVIVIFSAFYQSRKIILPITTLLNASKNVAKGDIHQRVQLESSNEIGQLAESFNHMLEVRQTYEEELEETTHNAKLAYLELESQKFALDQHAIVAITDTAGTITFANNKFCEISGYEEHEILNQNHRLLNSGYHDASFFVEMFKKISQGETWHGEVCNKAKDGHLYWVDTTITPFMNDKGKPESYIAIRTDITASKIAEEKAEAATQQKSEFLANMSHEIRTPMNGIIGMTGLLLETNLIPRQEELAKNTLKSAEALLTIINDILDFSKIEAGKLELEQLPFDFRDLAEDVSEFMAMKCQEKNIEMLLRYKPETPNIVIGDPGRVRQILLNLLSNAIKFTDKGNILLTIESLSKSNDYVTLSCSIKDTGIGIEKEHLKKIFNKFDQEDGSTTRKYGGTGLGLAICKQLCNMMNGEISVKSKKGFGTTFLFTIKLPVVDITESNQIGDKESINISTVSNLKTLVIDDLEIARKIISEQLTSFNVNVETASSGKEGIKKIKQSTLSGHPYDIVITDYNMPEMNGEMLAKEITSRKLLPNGALVFITATPRNEDNKTLKSLGFDGYITKPTRSLEVAQILSVIWEAKRKGKNIPLVTRHISRNNQINSQETIELKNTHILLTEDNPVNKLVATQYLEKYGCSITPAGNGLEALIQFKRNNFDLILMDCQMPEMDGFEATKKIREFEMEKNKKRTPIIAFTANAMQGDKDICLAAGMDDYISKPVNTQALKEMLTKWLPEKVIIIKKESSKITENGIDHIFNTDSFNSLKSLFKQDFPSAVKQYTDNARDNIIQIETAIKEDSVDIKTLERMAHSIKGASAQFGATALNKIAEDMENLAENGNIDEIIRLLPTMKIAQIEITDIMLEKASSNK